jgi:CheY-like chemotaxis protein
MLLRVLGYEVVQAASAEEAFQTATETERPDLVLTDMVMPGGGGRQLAQRLQEAFPGLPVVLMTGYADETTASPEFVILSKPFTRRQLSDVVEAALAE